MMRVTIKASDVAAVIGRHIYKPRSEVFAETWKKYKPETFTGKTRKDLANDILRESPLARDVLSIVSGLKPKNSSEVQEITSNVRIEINKDPVLSQAKKDEIISHITSRVYTSHGTRSEDKTSDKVVAETGATLVKDNAFYNHEICMLGDIRFVLTGKIDRIEECPDGSKILVEIKNRTNRLFGRVVEYENIQVQVYLQMLGLVRGRLVEQYNNQVLSHEIIRDEELWSNVIQPGLRSFCEELHNSWNNI